MAQITSLRGDFELIDPKYRAYVREKLFRENVGLDNKGELCLLLVKKTEANTPDSEIGGTVDPITGFIPFDDSCPGNGGIFDCNVDTFGQKYVGGWRIPATPLLFRMYFDEEAASVSIEDTGITETSSITAYTLNNPVINWADLIFRSNNRLLSVIDRPRRREEQGYLVHQTVNLDLLEQNHPYYNIVQCFPDTPQWQIVKDKILAEQDDPLPDPNC